MVDVRVRAHADDVARPPAAREPRQVRPQLAGAVARVDEQVPVTPAQVPDAGAEQIVHVRLGDDGRPRRDPGEAEPVGGDRELGPDGVLGAFVCHAPILSGAASAGASRRAARSDTLGRVLTILSGLLSRSLLRDERHVLAARHARDAGAHADGLGDRDGHRRQSCPWRWSLRGLPHGGEWSGAGLSALAGDPLLRRAVLPVRGLNVGDLGLISALISLHGAYVAVVVILLGEPVTPLLVLALVMCVAGARAHLARGPRGTTRGAAWGFAAGLLFAG